MTDQQYQHKIKRYMIRWAISAAGKPSQDIPLSQSKILSLVEWFVVWSLSEFESQPWKSWGCVSVFGVTYYRNYRVLMFMHKYNIDRYDVDASVFPFEPSVFPFCLLFVVCCLVQTYMMGSVVLDCVSELLLPSYTLHGSLSLHGVIHCTIWSLASFETEAIEFALFAYGDPLTKLSWCAYTWLHTLHINRL